MQPRETLISIATPLGFRLNPRERDEPPDDFRREARQNAYRNVKVAHSQRAGIASPHSAGAGLSGVTGDDGLSGATGVPVALPDGLPVARAINPWAMPEASTYRRQI